ncbi:MAG: CRISPR-associated endonuclease Cas2 [Chloroflexota bacterium]|nr:CRISPR-associated endonuclease Cas2 [Planctomycetota bacterium]MDW8255342.1 CRISPR-associated endonuclease Cas2 [Chloroflexota bacterium]
MRSPWIVSYDIADERRLRRVARICSHYGERVQFSVFVCHLDRMLLAKLQADLLPIIHRDEDQVIFARLESLDAQHLSSIGKRLSLTQRIVII